MNKFDEQLSATAAQSRDALLEHMLKENIKPENKLWGFIARAIVDARIDGMAHGMTTMENRTQLESYVKGYTDAITDLGKRETK